MRAQGKILIGSVGSATPLTALNLFGGKISVGGVNTSGAQTYTASTSMTATGALIAGSTVTLNGGGSFSLLNAGNSFALLAVNAGTVNLADSTALTLGNAVTTDALALSDAGGITLGASVSGGSVTLTGPITLVTDTSVTASGGDVTIGGSINGTNTGAQSLTVNAGTGGVTLGDVGVEVALNTLNITGGIVNLATVDTSGAQTYDTSDTFNTTGAVTAGGLITLQGAGSYTLTNNANSFGSLTANAGSINLFDTTLLSVGSVTTVGGLTLSDPAGFVFTGPLTTSGGAISISGPVTLGADIAIATGGGGVLVNNNIDGTAAGAQSLTVNAGNGAVTLGNIGTNVALNTLSVTGGTVSLGTVDTLGAETYTVSTSMTANGPVVAGDMVTLNGTGAFSLLNIGNSFGSLAINAGAVNLVDNTALILGNAATTGALTLSDSSGITLGAPLSGGSVSLTGPITLITDTSITATSGDINAGSIDGSTSGGQSLTVNAGAGNVTLGNIGTNVALNTLSVTGGTVSLGTVGTSGAETYAVSATLTTTGPVIAGGLLTLNGTGSYTLSNTGNQFGSLTANTGSINLTDAQALTLDAITVASGLTASDAAGFNLIGPVTASTGDIKLTGPVTLVNPDSDITSITGNVTVSGIINGADVGGQSLTVSALDGTVTLGNIGTGVALDNLTINAASQTLGQVVTKGMQNLGGAVTLTGVDTVAQFNAKSVTLTGDGSIDTSADNGLVDIGTLNGEFNLGINAGTGSVIIGTAGNTTALASLNVTGGSISLGSITTTGNQTYNGFITGGGAITLAAGSGSILFNGNLGTVTQKVASLNINSAANVTLFHNDANNIYYTLNVHNFTASLTGLISLGIHSLESDGDVSILSSSVDGRIVTTGNVGITTGSLSGTVAGNNVNIDASGNVNANVSGGTITVAANDFTGSATATRSASITAVDTINANVSAPVATLTAGNTVQGSVSGNSVTINAPNVNEALNEGQVTVVNSSSANLTGVVGGSTDLAQSVNFVPAAPIGTGNNGQPLGGSPVPQSVVNATQVAQNTTTAAEDDVSTTDQGDSGTPAAKKKSTSANGQNCDPNKDGACATQVASTYDYANKYVDKLLNGGR